MSSVFHLLATSFFAHSTLIELPVAGLSVTTDAPLGVESAWDQTGGADWLTLDGVRRYQIDVAGRTVGDCPMNAPDVREIGGVDWIVDDDTLCRVVGDARLRVKRLGPALAAEDALLTALGDSFATRRVTSAPLPPPAGPVGGPARLPVTGLDLDLPTDGLWRVVPPSAARDHDGLVRLVPALPEIQVVVRRHARAELESCAAMRRRLLAGGWAATETSKIEMIPTAAPPAAGPRRSRSKRASDTNEFSAVAKNRFAGFESIAWCAEHPDALLDVRVASWPKVSPTALTALLHALARASSDQPPLPSVLARRDADQILDAWAVATGGILLDDTSSSPHVFATEAGLAWALRDGLAVTVRGRLGHDGDGLAWGASAELGASVIVASDLALVLSLGWLEQHDALLDNRALGLTLELRRGWFAYPDGLRWTLRVAGIHLASQVPKILAAPLEIVWQGDLGGLVFGLSLRSAPTEVRDGGDAVELGLRVGWGRLWR